MHLTGDFCGIIMRLVQGTVRRISNYEGNMTQEYTVTIPAIPFPLRWQGTPQRWAPEGDNAFSATAGGKTDWFINPEVAMRVHNASALLFAVQAPCQLIARVTVDAPATFDAGVLTVRHAEDVWAKL